MNKRIIGIIGIMAALSGCNSIYVRPNATMEPGTMVYVKRGGYTMKRTIKSEMEQRGYDMFVGRLKTVREKSDGDDEMVLDKMPADVKYIVTVAEREEKFRPIVCSLRGMWWWNFNVSISEQETGHEIMSWRGRGCADGEVMKLNRVLDKLEGKK